MTESFSELFGVWGFCIDRLMFIIMTSEEVVIFSSRIGHDYSFFVSEFMIYEILKSECFFILQCLSGA